MALSQVPVSGSYTWSDGSSPAPTGTVHFKSKYEIGQGSGNKVYAEKTFTLVSGAIPNGSTVDALQGDPGVYPSTGNYYEVTETIGGRVSSSTEEAFVGRVIVLGVDPVAKPTLGQVSYDPSGAAVDKLLAVATVDGSGNVTGWKLATGGGGAIDTEGVQDIVGAMVAAGARITATYNDAAGTLTIATTATAVSVDGTPQSTVNIDTTAVTPADIGALPARSPRAARHDRTSGNVDLASVTWTDVDNALDVVLGAHEGDAVELGLSYYADGAQYVFLDAVTVVSGSPVHDVSRQGTPADTTYGVQAWSANTGEATRGGSVLYIVQASDISGGLVRFRLRGRTDGASPAKSISASADGPLTFYGVVVG